MNNKDELSSHGIKPNCCILNTRRTIGTYGKKRVKIKKRSSIEIRNQDRASFVSKHIGTANIFLNDDLLSAPTL